MGWGEDHETSSSRETPLVPLDPQMEVRGSAEHVEFTGEKQRLPGFNLTSVWSGGGFTSTLI